MPLSPPLVCARIHIFYVSNLSLSLPVMFSRVWAEMLFNPHSHGTRQTLTPLLFLLTFFSHSHFILQRRAAYKKRVKQQQKLPGWTNLSQFCCVHVILRLFLSISTKENEPAQSLDENFVLYFFFSYELLTCLCSIFSVSSKQREPTQSTRVCTRTTWTNKHSQQTT